MSLLKFDVVGSKRGNLKASWIGSGSIVIPIQLEKGWSPGKFWNSAYL